MADHSLRTMAAVAARQAVLETIQASQEGMTIQEAAHTHSLTYHTARNYILTLVEEGKIDTNGKSRDRQVVFMPKDFSRMPKYRGKPIWNILRKTSSDDFNKPIALTEVSRAYLITMARLFDEAKKSTMTGPGNPPITRKELRPLRTQLMQILDVAEEFVADVKAAVENPSLWESGESLEKVLLEDPETPVKAQDINDLIYQHTQRYNASRGQI